MYPGCGVGGIGFLMAQMWINVDKSGVWWWAVLAMTWKEERSLFNNIL